MDGYDILMIAILAGTTLFGAMKGMAWQLASLASLVLSYFVAYHFSKPLVDTGLFGIVAPWNRFAAMLAIYTATGAIVWLMFRRVSQSIETFKMRDFDRQLGAIFGLFKGVMLCVAVTFFVVALLPDDSRRKILSSYSGQYIARMLGKADKVMPAEWLTVLRPYLDQLEDKFNDGQPTNGLPGTNNSSWPVSSPSNGYSNGYQNNNGQQSRGGNEPRPLLDFMNQAPQNPAPQYQNQIPGQPYSPPYQSQPILNTPIPNAQYNPVQPNLNQQVYATNGLQPIVNPGMYSGNPAYPHQGVAAQYPQPNYQQASYPQQPYNPQAAMNMAYNSSVQGYAQPNYVQPNSNQPLYNSQPAGYATGYPPTQQYASQSQVYAPQPYAQPSYDLAQQSYSQYHAQNSQYTPEQQSRQYHGPIESPSIWKWAELATPTENRFY